MKTYSQLLQAHVMQSECSKTQDSLELAGAGAGKHVDCSVHSAGGVYSCSWPIMFSGVVKKQSWLFVVVYRLYC